MHATRDLSKCILKHRASADSLPPQDKELVQKIYASICFCDYDAALKISFHVMSLLFQIINECNKVEQWLKEKIQQQESFPKNTDPILWSSDIKSKTEELNLYDFCFLFQKCIFIVFYESMRHKSREQLFIKS